MIQFVDRAIARVGDNGGETQAAILVAREPRRLLPEEADDSFPSDGGRTFGTNRLTMPAFLRAEKLHKVEIHTLPTLYFQ